MSENGERDEEVEWVMCETATGRVLDRWTEPAPTDWRTPSDETPRRRMSDDQPDRHVSFPGGYHIVLWEGLFLSRIRIYKDVWPALGGLLGSRIVRRSKGEAEFEKVVAEVREILESQ